LTTRSGSKPASKETFRPEGRNGTSGHINPEGDAQQHWWACIINAEFAYTPGYRAVHKTLLIQIAD
jgi:hypothetical protein